MARQPDNKFDIEFGAGREAPTTDDAVAVRGSDPIARADSGSGRLDGDTIDTAGADLKLDSIANGDLGSGRSGGDEVDPFAEEMTGIIDDSDDFGLESKLDHVADEPMDEDAIDDLPEDI